VKRLLLAVILTGSIACGISASAAHAAEAPDKSATVAATPAAKTGSTTKAAGAAKTPAKAAATTAPIQAVTVDTLALLERSVARDSSKFDNLYRLGVMYLDRDRLPEAERVLTRAHKLRPKDVPTVVNLGALLDALNKPEAAQTRYREALALSPEDSVATCRLASSLYAQMKYAEAMDLLRNLIASKPNSHCAYFTLGVAFADAGIYRDAIRMWRKVVELAPTSPEAASANESIDVLEKFIQQNPTPETVPTKP
jgi:tetratricopeptide (TPR) repeat protein